MLGNTNHIWAEIGGKVVGFSVRNVNIYEICKPHKAIYSVFYKIL